VQASPDSAPKQVGRYAIYEPIATGGMATVHLGRLVGPASFARTVAIKRLHPQFARDPEFVSMFLDEARVAARIQHPNVVPTIDVIATEGELLLVMEYVRGEALSRLVRGSAKRLERVPPKIVVSIITSALHGLHAAHEAKDDAGRSLAIVHRDVSPQNILVGMDGVSRVLDFGVAKAEDRVQVTKDNKLKGKLLYMSPEQLESGEVDRRTDVYAMAVVLFEALTQQRMFPGEREGAQLLKIQQGEIRVPSQVIPELAMFDDVVRKGASKNPADRFATARDFARALETVVQPASTTDVGEWVENLAGTAITERTKRIAEIESAARLDPNAVRNSLAEELERSQRSFSGVIEPSGSGIAISQKPKPTSKLWLVAFVALLGLLSAAVAFFLWSQNKKQSVAATPTVTQPPATITQIIIAQPAPTTFDTQTAPDPSASAAVIAPAAHVVHAAASASVKKKDCEQPYVIDSTGHMHFRKECL
jgi:serine/threonine-protein kinase